VNPAEIEQVVQTLPGISACQVVAAQWHQKPCLWPLFVENPSDQVPAQWQAECKRRLAGFKVPVHFEVLEEFPTILSANAVKIQKHKLREMAQARLDSKP
jgi:Acyl-CoA synthetases (AMP-forming)/AMP-acid ligases II